MIRYFVVNVTVQSQGTGKIHLLYRDFFISRFFFIYFTITKAKKIVRYTKHFVQQRFVCYISPLKLKFNKGRNRHQIQ